MKINDEFNEDSLNIFKNSDGTFTLEWDRNDPNWSFLNNLTEEEIQTIIYKEMNS